MVLRWWIKNKKYILNSTFDVLSNRIIKLSRLSHCSHQQLYLHICNWQCNQMWSPNIWCFLQWWLLVSPSLRALTSPRPSTETWSCGSERWTGCSSSVQRRLHWESASSTACCPPSRWGGRFQTTPQCLNCKISINLNFRPEQMVHWPLDQDQVCIQWQEHFMCERAAHRTLNDHLLMLVHLLKVWL